MVANVAAIALAVPPAKSQKALWDGYFSQVYAGNRVAPHAWAASGVQTRHGVVDPTIEDVSQWSTAQRMQRYVAEAMPLGKEAVAAALETAGVAAHDVGLFTVVSCTGYATPGLDILLARDLGMSASTQRLMIGHMGCYAAIPALAAVGDAATARGLVGVLLCVELVSLHAQPPCGDTEQIISHALFSDAAAAVVIKPDGAGLQLVDVVASTDQTHVEKMTWDITDLGFRMGLSPQVPDVLAAQVGGVVDNLLLRNGLQRSDVAGWAVHPGGPRILDVVGDRLGLASDALDVSRDTLRDHGNCSSPTVLMVIEEMLRRRTPDEGDAIVALAFGPGLTLYAALLRWQS
ncbi:MAG: type III polyketide synthase [Actinomycetota bacterium]